MKLWLVKHQEAIRYGIPVIILSLNFWGILGILTKPASTTLISSLWPFGLMVLLMLGYAALILYISRIAYFLQFIENLKSQIADADEQIFLLQSDPRAIEALNN